MDFQSPSLSEIADFLLHLFKEKHLQPSTIDDYRTADKIGMTGSISAKMRI